MLQERDLVIKAWFFRQTSSLVHYNFITNLNGQSTQTGALGYIGNERSITSRLSYRRMTSISFRYWWTLCLPQFFNTSRSAQSMKQRWEYYKHFLWSLGMKYLPAIYLRRGANNLTKRWMNFFNLWRHLASIAISKVLLPLNTARKASGTLSLLGYVHLRYARGYWRTIR